MSLKAILTYGALLALALTVGLSGCNKAGDKTTPAGAAVEQVSEEGHSHDGWWCNEHGVPEEVCAQCNTKLVADFKAKGDWCNEHDRPDSQCFACHPEKQAEFAAQYEAKYGKQPPTPTADDEGHEHDEKGAKS